MSAPEMLSAERQKKPHLGALIYGCQHAPLCGSVVLVLGQTNTGSWRVVENCYQREVTVRREANGLYYETFWWTNYDE